jgi:hypothetical protein
MPAGASAVRSSERSTPHRPHDRALRACLLVLSIALLALVGLSGPNAASPDLAPHGWAPGALLPVRLGPAAVTAALWTAYGLGALAVLLGLRGAARATSWWPPLGLSVLAVLTAPFGSGDHLNYAAYGRILVQGGNPWTESPIAWAGGHDPVTSRVEEPWTTEPSVYGPFATLLHGLAALAGGDNLRQVVWVWQLVVIASWLAIRWLLRTLLDDSTHGRIDVLWTLNPLVLGMGLFGAHVDTVGAALAVAAVWAGSRGAGSRWFDASVDVRVAGAKGAGPVSWVWPALAGGLGALAGCVKFTYAVVLVALAIAWWLRRGERSTWLRAVALLAAGALVVGGSLHLWSGAHTYDQLSRSRRSVSLATPWRLLLEALRGPLGESATRSLITVGAALLALALAAALLRLVTAYPSPRQATVAGRALGLLAVLSAAYSLAAPYSLPWYDAAIWAGLPALAAPLVDRTLLARLVLMTVAYVPGRVLGMTAEVRDVTMTVRRSVAPGVSLLIWLVILGAGLHAWSRSRGPHAGAPTPRPTR